MSLRYDNGVKVRVDCKGDAWADAHRTDLGKEYYFQDLDATFGAQFFGMNTGERLFLEYEPDHYDNRSNSIREFAAIAMFDRKATERAAFAINNKLTRDFYLYLCRSLSERQPVPPRFFYVIGGQRPPWRMIEIDIQTAERCGQDVEVDHKDWHVIWDRLGLIRARDELRRFIGRRRTP